MPRRAHASERHDAVSAKTDISRHSCFPKAEPILASRRTSRSPGSGAAPLDESNRHGDRRMANSPLAGSAVPQFARPCRARPRLGFHNDPVYPARAGVPVGKFPYPCQGHPHPARRTAQDVETAAGAARVVSRTVRHRRKRCNMMSEDGGTAQSPSDENGGKGLLAILPGLGGKPRSRPAVGAAP